MGKLVGAVLVGLGLLCAYGAYDAIFNDNDHSGEAERFAVINGDFQAANYYHSTAGHPWLKKIAYGAGCGIFTGIGLLFFSGSKSGQFKSVV